MVEEHLNDEVVLPAAELIAWEQSGGIGRGGRKWSSPAGAGVWATLVRSEADTALQLLPAAVAVALCEVAQRHLPAEGPRCSIKWPNDLQVDGAKLGGILIDSISRPDRNPSVVASFGLNWTSDLSLLLAPQPASLGALGCSTSLAEVAYETVSAVATVLDEPVDAERLAERYLELSVHQLGDRLRVRDVAAVGPGGSLPTEGLSGRFLGFDESGLLRLDVGGEERRFSAGTVEPGEAAPESPALGDR